MDPDEVLRKLRRAISRARDVQEGAEAADTDLVEIDVLREVCDHAEDLDRWLSQGGFLPRRWDKAKAAV